jgi:hypothetical protein
VNEAILAYQEPHESKKRARVQACFGREPGQSNACGSSPRNPLQKLMRRLRAIHSFEPYQALRLSQIGKRMRIHHNPTSNGGGGRTLPQHETVARHQYLGRMKPEPHQSASACLDRPVIVERNGRKHVGGERVKVHLGAMFQASDARQQRSFNVND